MEDNDLMKQPRVSVIMPVYGVEEYIADSLESVLSQDFDDMEVIIVDDCTLDQSMDVVANILSSYSGSKVCRTIRHEENLGLSAARNTGIKEAKGDWVFFIDSDDRLLSGGLQALVTVADTYPHVEVVQGSTVVQYPENNEWLNYVLDIHDKGYPEYTEDHFWIAKNMLTVLPMTAWNKLVKRTFIIQNDLFFKEGLIHEDELWRWQMSKLIQGYATCTHQCYWYRTDNSSSIKGNIDLTKSYVAYLTILADIFTEITTLPEFEFVFDFFGGIEYKESQWPYIKDKRMVNLVLQKLRRKVLRSSAPRGIKMLLLVLSLPYSLTKSSQVKRYFCKLREKMRMQY